MFGLKNGIWKPFKSGASIFKRGQWWNDTVRNVADPTSVKICSKTHIIKSICFIPCRSWKVNSQMFILQTAEK